MRSCLFMHPIRSDVDRDDEKNDSSIFRVGWIGKRKNAREFQMTRAQGLGRDCGFDRIGNGARESTAPAGKNRIAYVKAPVVISP